MIGVGIMIVSRRVITLIEVRRLIPMFISILLVKWRRLVILILFAKWRKLISIVSAMWRRLRSWVRNRRLLTLGS